MNILFVCTKSFKDSVTGAGTQIRETYSALVGLGETVRRIYVDFLPTRFEDEHGHALTNEEVVSLDEWADVVHLIHCSWLMAHAWRKIGRKPTVGSTIYWSGFERVLTAWKTYSGSWSCFRAVCSYGRDVIPKNKSIKGVDVFLPNSNAEGVRFMYTFRTGARAICIPVPNGFLLPNFDVGSLPRPSCVPQNEYIVVPGVFARRKNQIGLIKALKGSGYSIVFMGDAIDRDFYDECRKAASKNMFFIGHKENGSAEYWSVLRHARCACLPSDCETPGIAMIEAAFAGARPIITRYGGTIEYYGFDAEYLIPYKETSIRNAIVRAWNRGRLTKEQASAYKRFSWRYCAEITRQAYQIAIQKLLEIILKIPYNKLLSLHI